MKFLCKNSVLHRPRFELTPIPYSAKNGPGRFSKSAAVIGVLVVYSLAAAHLALGIGIDEGLLVNPPHVFDSTDVKDILTTEIPGAIQNTLTYCPCTNHRPDEYYSRYHSFLLLGT